MVRYANPDYMDERRTQLCLFRVSPSQHIYDAIAHLRRHGYERAVIEAAGPKFYVFAETAEALSRIKLLWEQDMIELVLTEFPHSDPQVQ